MSDKRGDVVKLVAASIVLILVIAGAYWMGVRGKTVITAPVATTAIAPATSAVVPPSAPVAPATAPTVPPVQPASATVTPPVPTVPAPAVSTPTPAEVALHEVKEALEKERARREEIEEISKRQLAEAFRTRKVLAEAETETAKVKADAQKIAETAIAVLKAAGEHLASSRSEHAVSGIPPASVSVAPTTANGGIPADPYIDGKDVLVPDVLILAIPGFDPSKPVYAAHDYNGWFVRGESWATDRKVEAAKMVKEGGFWRAKGVAGKRFHPVQLEDRGGQPLWAKIEDVYVMNSASFVDQSGSGPCLLVKR